MKKFFSTNHDFGMLILRVSAGAAMLPFGLQKVGLMGDGSFAQTMTQLTGSGIPWIIAFLVIAGESLGALSLILGFFTRFCAASLAVIMAGAVVILFGKGYAMGYALPLLFALMYLPLVLNGAGAWSVDGAIAKKLSNQ